MSTRIQQGPFASSFVNHSELVAVGPGHRSWISVTPFPPKSWTWLLLGVKAYHRSSSCAPWAKASLFMYPPTPPHPVNSLLFILCTCPVPFLLYLCNLHRVAIPYSQSPLSLCHQRENFPICSFTVYEKKVVCICIYMCLSYYEYYNKTNTSLSMLWPFLPWNICWERRNSHTERPPPLEWWADLCRHSGSLRCWWGGKGGFSLTWRVIIDKTR